MKNYVSIGYKWMDVVVLLLLFTLCDKQAISRRVAGKLHKIFLLR